jgi:DNA-binding MarR family transcriptional regulator
MFHYRDCILFNLTKAYQRVEGIFRSHYQKYNLTTMQTLVLEALYHEEGLSSGEIGKRLVIDNSTLSGIFDRMYEAGWIIKKVTEEDKRFLEISLTEKALKIRDELLKDTIELNQIVMSDFKTEEKLLLFRMLQDLRK